jgi:hypothetical protein
MLNAVLSTSLVSGGKLLASSDTVAPSLAAFCVVQYIGISRILPRNGNAAIINLSPLHSIIRTTPRGNWGKRKKNILAEIIFCAVDILLSQNPTHHQPMELFVILTARPKSASKTQQQ